MKTFVIVSALFVTLMCAVAAYRETRFTGVVVINKTGGPVLVEVSCFTEEGPALHDFVLADGNEASLPLVCPDEGFEATPGAEEL